jgi:hypothetical protein
VFIGNRIWDAKLRRINERYQGKGRKRKDPKENRRQKTLSEVDTKGMHSGKTKRKGLELKEVPKVTRDDDSSKKDIVPKGSREVLYIFPGKVIS